ncbi:MAG TPA: hypothetical protein VGE17_07060 [Methylophilus sp.]
MDNKYGLGSRRLATEHHQQAHASKPMAHHPLTCRVCHSSSLRLCPTMEDHQCNDCGEWQMDLPAGYAIGRDAGY